MTHHFEIQSERLIPWGHSGNQPLATRDAIHPRDSSFLSASAPLKRSEVAQALIDISLVIVASVGVVSLVVAFYILLFVRH